MDVSTHSPLLPPSLPPPSHPPQVFDVFLDKHHIIADMDIFAKVGRAAAYDEVVQFAVKDETLYVGTETSKFDGTLTIEFAKVRLFTDSI